MRCPSCGNEDFAAGAFCAACGASMNSGPVTQGPQWAAPVPTRPARPSRRLVAAAAAGFVVLAATSGVVAYWLINNTSPAEAMAAVIENVEELRSYAFTMDVEMETLGQTIEMQMEGVAQGDAYDPADSALRMDGSMSILGESIGMSEIMVDGRLYLRYEPNPIDSSSQWYFMDFDLSGVQSAGQGAQNPTEYLEFMKAYSTVEAKGTTTVDGVKCQHYYLVIDAEKLADMAAENARELADQLPSTEGDSVTTEQMRAMYEDAEITVDLYIGVDDGLPHRQELTMVLQEPVEVELVLTMDLFDFNKPVDITAPEGAVPLPAELGGTSDSVI